MWWRGLLASTFCPQSTIPLPWGSSCPSSPAHPSFILWAFPESQHYDVLRVLNRDENEGVLSRENRWANRFLCLPPISPVALSCPLPPKTNVSMEPLLSCLLICNILRGDSDEINILSDHLSQYANKAWPKMSQIVFFSSIPISPTPVSVFICLLSSNIFDLFFLFQPSYHPFHSLHCKWSLNSIAQISSRCFPSLKSSVAPFGL